MSRRRGLTLDAFFDRVEAVFRYEAPSPRRRIRGDDGRLIWLAWADAPAAHIHAFDRNRPTADVTVFTRMAFRSWR